jgi:chorismate synthase
VFTYRTAGESHGPGLVILMEGLPAGIPLEAADIDKDLARRQKGYGRGGRMAIEADAVEFVAGVRWGRTTGAPAALTIRNRDWANWTEAMSPDRAFEGSAKPLTRVRPGHADLPGVLKYGLTDAREILERSSARETASRVAAGAVAKQLLALFDIRIGSIVTSIGPVSYVPDGSWWELFERAESSPLRMADAEAERSAMAAVDQARTEGDTLGGIFLCFATGLPVGLGSHVSAEERLDGRIAQALVSIPAIKGVEIGIGFEAARLPGSRVHDEIEPGGPGDSRRGNVRRATNRAGGLEGGITNGEPVWVRAAMKPIPTLMKPLRTVDLATGAPDTASTERSDVCAVPAAAVVGEAMLALVLARVFLEKFGGDSVGEVERNFTAYLDALERRWKK